MVRQAVRFNGLAPNMIVKIPVTKAGVAAIEEATFQGVSINATVSFTVPRHRGGGGGGAGALAPPEGGPGHLRDGPGVHASWWAAWMTG